MRGSKMYLGYQDGKIKFYTEELLDSKFYQLDKQEYTDKEYVLDGEEFVLKDNEWKNKQLLIEADKISKLSLTKRELFLCLYKALGITPESIRASILENQEALIEFDYAEKYYRGNPLVESLGLALGLTSEIIDKIFISGGNPDVIKNKGGDGADA